MYITPARSSKPWLPLVFRFLVDCRLKIEAAIGLHQSMFNRAVCTAPHTLYIGHIELQQQAKHTCTYK